jgi:CheY-like chemotaxis protein
MSTRVDHGQTDHRQADHRDCRILVVEDEYFIADDIARSLRLLGAEAIGPAADTRTAMALIEQPGKIDAAILDINLGGVEVYPVARALKNRGILFCFATGYSRTSIDPEFRDVLRWEKPYNTLAMVRDILDRAHSC